MRKAYIGTIMGIAGALLYAAYFPPEWGGHAYIALGFTGVLVFLFYWNVS